jgi:hypothetical protein
MPERTSISQVVQLGSEATAGTSVAATKRLPSIQFDVSVEGSATPIETSGFKFNTGYVPGKEWASAKLSGQPTYDELAYILSSVLQKVNPTTVATTGRSWAFQPSSSAEDTVATFTVEQGSATRAHKFAYGLVHEFGLKGDRDKLEVSGSMFGQLLTDGISLTASPTTIAQIPMLPKEVDIYLDDTSAALGTTKLTRAFSWDLALKGRQMPFWTVDSAQTSWAGAVEGKVDASFKVKIAADAVHGGLLTTYRAGTTKWLRLKITSAQQAGTATPYSLTVEAPLQVMEPPKKFEDQDGVFAIEYSFGLVHDGTWGKALTATLVNKLAAL